MHREGFDEVLEIVQPCRRCSSRQPLYAAWDLDNALLSIDYDATRAPGEAADHGEQLLLGR